MTVLNAEDVARFVEQAQTEFNIEQGETTVFTLDIPDVPQHYASVMVAQTNQAAVSKERAMGICFAVEHGAMLSPEGVAQEYFGYYENNKAVALPSPSDAELVVQPKHGKVDYIKRQDGLLHARYLADAGYLGDDKLVFKVKVDGKIVRVHYLLKVTDKGADNGEVQDLLCKKTGIRWKISLPNAPVDNLAIQPLLDSTGISGAEILGSVLTFQHSNFSNPCSLLAGRDYLLRPGQCLDHHAADRLRIEAALCGRGGDIIGV